ncbi:MAG: hypothetical protein ABEI52_05545 [Halobacteriaceae archaeon]
MLASSKTIEEAFKLYVYACVGLERFTKSIVHLVRVYFPCEHDLEFAARAMHKTVMVARKDGPESVDCSALRAFFEDDPSRVEYAIHTEDVFRSHVVIIVEVGSGIPSASSTSTLDPEPFRVRGITLRDDPQFVRISVFKGPLMQHVSTLRMDETGDASGKRELAEEKQQQEGDDGIPAFHDPWGATTLSKAVRPSVGHEVARSRRYRHRVNTWAV